MTQQNLTPVIGDATRPNANGQACIFGQGRKMKRLNAKSGWAALSLVGALGLGGCINVAAPEEPIVIELNVNIRAEVLYRLAEDASNTIDENADIF